MEDGEGNLLKRKGLQKSIALNHLGWLFAFAAGSIVLRVT
jgi:hypothetical protein